jgi:hypothetical protein
MRLTAKSTFLTAIVLGLPLCIVEPALVQSAGPIGYRDSARRLHTGAGIRAGHLRRHYYGPSVIQPGLGLSTYQPYYPHEFHGENYGRYPLVPFDYPNIVPEYSR